MSDVTGNASTQEGADVTRNACPTCAKYRRPEGPKDEGEQLHCTTCHAYDHLACARCGACMPRGHRYDRIYCSGTCRALAVKDRQRARLQRQQWEAEHPDEARREQEELEQWKEAVRQLMSVAGVGSPEAREARERVSQLRARAERCAFRYWHSTREPGDDSPGPKGEWIACDKPFGPGDVIYRRAEHFGLHRTVLPFCAEHCCGQDEGYHNRDAPPGRYYRHCCCPDDERGRRHWLKPEPCAYCGRLVSNDHETANPWRFMRTWRYMGEDRADVVRTFCSEDCRRAVFGTLAKSKRLAARADARAGRKCEQCGEVLDADRADARYCSNACRQRAYRQRQMTHQ